MELFILLGALSFAMLAGMAATNHLRQRRAGSIVAVRVGTARHR